MVRTPHGKDSVTCLKHAFDQGSLYDGHENRTVTGKKCLTWAKPKLAFGFKFIEMENGKVRRVASNYCRNGGRGIKR